MSVFRFVLRTYNRTRFLLGVFTFSVDSDYEKGSFELVRKAMLIFNIQFQYATRVTQTKKIG